MRSAATTSPCPSATTTETGAEAEARTALITASARSWVIGASIPWPRGGLRAQHALQRDACPHRARVFGAVGHLRGDVRRGLALRDTRVERHRPLRRAHVLQGHRAPADLTRDRRRDRRHRRRVQRLHQQGADRLLRQVRRGDARHGAGRARGHAAAVEVRRRRDRAGEGRHRRGDEHVLRHAPQLHRLDLRAAAVRRPAARLGRHRAQGDGARRDAGDVPLVSRPLVPARAHGDRSRRPSSATICTSGWRSSSAGSSTARPAGRCRSQLPRTAAR